MEQESKVNADKLELNYEKNILSCRDNVLITKENGSYLKADSFHSNLDEGETGFEKFSLQYFYDEETGKPVSKDESDKFVSSKDKDEKEKPKDKDIPIIMPGEDDDPYEFKELTPEERFELGIFEGLEK